MSMTRREFLKGIAASAVGVAGLSVMGVSAAAEEAAGIYTPGTYTATATGIGTVTMTATFDANSITAIDLDVSQETESIGQAAKDQLIEQLLAAQSSDIDGVSGASLTSAAAKSCLDDCIAQAKGQQVVEKTESALPLANYMCPEDWLGEAPVIDPSQIVATKEADVIVVGGGHAGTQAFLAACQEGASAILLESQAEESYSCYGEDICTYNSKFLTDLGFGGYDVGEITAEYIRRACGRCSAELIYKYVANSGEMLDNLISIWPDTSDMFDYEGKQFQVQTGYNMPDSSYYPVMTGGYKGWASCIQTVGNANKTPVHGRDDVTRLTEVEMYSQDAAIELGGQIDWSTKGVVLVQDDNGDVTGVIGEGPDGYVQYNAKKGVILACGDFSGNADMCYNLLTDVNEISVRHGATRQEMGGMGRDGSGHKMGCWAGGVIEANPRPSNNSNGGSPGPWGTTPFLFMNADGNRFMNEAMPCFTNSTCARQPLGIITNICDANYMDSIKEGGMDHGAPNWGSVGVEEYGIMDMLQEDMSHVVESGADGYAVHALAVIKKDMGMTEMVYGSESLEEMLGFLGYEGDALQNALKTIDEYNTMCEAGVDSRFGKDARLMKPIKTAPFYGAVSVNTGKLSAGLVTLAGLVTDGNMNVLRADYTTHIKGLYAVGNCLGERYGLAYSSPSAGNSIGMALTHGRVCGKYVANL